jgi:hypothetical protein
MKKSTTITQIYDEIAYNDLRRLNWRAMRYFIRQKCWGKAAACRERVGGWNKRGPI